MKKTKRFFVFLCTLALLAACNQAERFPEPATEIVAEDAAIDTVSDGAAQNAPMIPDGSGDLIPDGVLVSTGSENSLTFLDAQGLVVREIETPGIITIGQEDVAIAGPILPDGPFPAIVYRSWLPVQALMTNTNGAIETQRVCDTFSALIGAPGQSALTFSEVKYNAENHPHGFLYAATDENLASAPAFFDLVDEPFYWVLKPAGVKTVGGEVQGVWYTKAAWGIGGADLIYPINRGLYFFDLTNGDNTQHLDDTRSFQGISPDLAFAASVEGANGGDPAMTTINLNTSETVKFPLDPATDRGAGFAVFSPDNHYAAWLEATGSMVSDPYDFHPRVRIGDIQSGGVVQALEDPAAAQAIHGDTVTMMRPAGWLDNETLLIEVRGKNWNDVTLLQFVVNTGDLTVFNQGSFLVFGYQ